MAKLILGLGVLLVALPYLLFGLRNGFVWLDHREILEGRLVVTSWRAVVDLFSDDRNYAGYYRPVYNLVHSLDLYLWGRNPFGFHLSSLLLHLANVLLLYGVCKALSFRAGHSLLLVVLWGLHPINTVVVGLIHAKADLVVVTCLAGSLLVVLRAPAGRWSQLAALGLVMIALYTKEVAYVYGLGLLIFRALLKKRISGVDAYVAGVLALTCAAALHRLMILPPGWYHSPLALGERLATFSVVYVEYVRRLLLPIDPSVADTVTVYDALDGSSRLWYAFALVFVLGSQLLLAARVPSLRNWLILYNLALLPVAQIVPILHFRADRFLYVPSFAFLGFCMDGVRTVLRRGEADRAKRIGMASIALGSALAACLLLDVRSLRGFENDEVLFRRELSRNPCYMEGLSSLARHHEVRGSLDLAARLYEASLKPCPGTISYVDESSVIINYSSVLLGQKRWREAYDWISEHEGRIEDRERLSLAAYNRAVAAYKLESYEEALPVFVAFVSAYPEDASAHFLGGMCALCLGEVEIAAALLKRYLDLQPTAEDRPLVEDALRVLERQ